MLEFQDKFFEREVREGHLVGELVKKAWAVQLDMLSKVDAICEKYHLTYFAYWGTLLGAVRHQGFIPWDDDLDIAFPRPDYMRFLEVVEKEMPAEYHLINNYVEDWTNSFSRITCGKRVSWNAEYLKEHYNCPFALGIDIFPLDYISRDSREAEEQKNIIIQIASTVTVLEERKRLEETGADVNGIEQLNEMIAASLVYLEQVCGVHFDGNVSLSKQLHILYDQVAALFCEEESDYLTDFPSYIRGGYILDKSFFSKIERIKFENITIPVPCGYDAILRKSYGEYMTPVKGTSTHGDLCFKEQIQMMAQQLESENKQFLSEEEEALFWEKAKEIVLSQGQKRKVIMVCNSMMETLAHDVKVVKKLRRIFEIFDKNPDVVLWWRACRIDTTQMDMLKKIVPHLFMEYNALVKEFKEKKNVVFDPGVSMKNVLEFCDAYYGDDNKIAKVFDMTGKPVMILDYNI